MINKRCLRNLGWSRHIIRPVIWIWCLTNTLVSMNSQGSKITFKDWILHCILPIDRSSSRQLLQCFLQLLISKILSLPIQAFSIMIPHSHVLQPLFFSEVLLHLSLVFGFLPIHCIYHLCDVVLLIKWKLIQGYQTFLFFVWIFVCSFEFVPLFNVKFWARARCTSIVSSFLLIF